MSEMSVRDEKRRQTAVHIHSLAQEMALKLGPSNVKIEAIAEAASISRRTFFNYFLTKEDAILGYQEPVLPKQALKTFETSDEPMLLKAVQLVAAVGATIKVQASPTERRAEIKNKYPELLHRLDYYAAATERLVRPVIETYLDQQDAEVTLRLTGAVMRYTYTIDPDLQPESVAASVKTFLNTINRIQ